MGGRRGGLRAIKRGKGGRSSRTVGLVDLGVGLAGRIGSYKEGSGDRVDRVVVVVVVVVVFLWGCTVCVWGS